MFLDTRMTTAQFMAIECITKIKMFGGIETLAERRALVQSSNEITRQRCNKFTGIEREFAERQQLTGSFNLIAR